MSRLREWWSILVHGCGTRCPGWKWGLGARPCVLKRNHDEHCEFGDAPLRGAEEGPGAD